ncbi:colicin-like pore-forming protein [Pseudocitrobacter sp. RIT415]|uniref:colicin-like pore-forming protein n=1 Tax=Pseudocitrobacter sp. RIT415 TaxID=2202163 RepID=UPI000D343E98|nr:colicin-like pore-forming protein [Pseudocitrobacter sp. RIT 415]
MSGGDGNGPGNTGLGHSGGQPSGNINGTSGSGGGTGGNGADGMTATGFHDPISGGMGITFSGSGSSVTSSGTTGGVNNGNGRSPKFTANIAGWTSASGTKGSLSKPVVGESWSKDSNEIGYFVGFGKEQYRVIYNIKSGTYKSVYVDGGASRPDQMMNDQALAIVKRYQMSKDEKSLLLGASAIIADVGGQVTTKLSAQYKNIAAIVANDIKNFQGKKVRSFDDAMKTLNSLMANPNLKLSAADKTAVANALRNLNLTDISNKLKNLSKGFAVADRALKIESVREAAIVGVQTGNWKPLGLEVESMVLSGIAGSISIAIVTAILGLLTAALPATLTVVVSYFAIVFIAYATSFIDAAAADRLNKEVINLFKH